MKVLFGINGLKNELGATQNIPRTARLGKWLCSARRARIESSPLILHDSKMNSTFFLHILLLGKVEFS